MKIWKCCKKLFSFGTLERRDAYRILSLYLCFFPHNEELGVAGMCDDGEESDIADKDIWEEIKRGLVVKHTFDCLLLIEIHLLVQLGILE